MTQKHGCDVYDYRTPEEKAQPWCTDCNLPLDICRGHEAVPSPSVDTIVAMWQQLDAMRECDLAAAMVRADVARADQFYALLGDTIKPVQSAEVVTVPLAQIAIGADALPADVAAALLAKHSAAWCERLIDELLTLLEAAKDAERHARIWDSIEAQLRVAQ